jgi:hypothetical protein
MIKATFTSAFPMEASMPQILEEALYACYIEKGWNVSKNIHNELGDKAFSYENNCFPIITDLIEKLKVIPKEKGFSEQMESDYVGSLVSRLSNLTVGSKGEMMNCTHSTDFDVIADSKVVIEMESIKSGEDKCLLMGFILSRLSETIKRKHMQNNSYKHITLVEESHRLLSKVEYGDSGSKKTAVEAFTDLLAEVRKYGEGLIIVDQIPNKLAPEVIKNTNTKIIHRILAHDDKETVGDAMIMDDKQKNYLAALPVGHAIVFNENMDKPVHIKVQMSTNTNDAVVSNSLVKRRFEKNKSFFGSCYEFPEIMENLGEFKRTTVYLLKQDFNESCAEMKEKISCIAKNNQVNCKEIITRFIRSAYLYSGTDAQNDIESNKKHTELTVNFFEQLFEKPQETLSGIYSDLPLVAALTRLNK